MLSVASPAVLVTVAAVLASYACPTPGTNVPKLAGWRAVSASVAGTVPPTVPCVQSERLSSAPRASLIVVVRRNPVRRRARDRVGLVDELARRRL